jgi:5-methylcytosine-specific restriction endonuclease McrA
MKFNNSKYTTWYNSIIERARTRELTGYKENHHIIPRSLGGDNSKENVVPLTAREHYIAHLLLPYIVNDPAHKRKMWGALRCMTIMHYKTHDRYAGSARFYAKAKENIDFGAGNRGRVQSPEERKKRATSLTGKVCSEETKRKIGKANSKNTGRTPWNKGKKMGPMSEEAKLKKSAALKGRKKSDAAKENMKAAQALRSKDSYVRPGYKHRQATLDKIKKAAQNRPRLTCPHCGLEGAVSGMKRYHFANCKAASPSSNNR